MLAGNLLQVKSRSRVTMFFLLSVQNNGEQCQNVHGKHAILRQNVLWS